jgi:hypothetical protein
MTEPAAAQFKVAADPHLPLAALTELRRLTDAVLSSAAFVTQGGAGDETEQDRASRFVREHRARKNTVADRAECGGNGSAGAVDVLASGSHRDGGKQ